MSDDTVLKTKEPRSNRADDVIAAAEKLEAEGLVLKASRRKVHSADDNRRAIRAAAKLSLREAEPPEPENLFWRTIRKIVHPFG